MTIRSGVRVKIQKKTGWSVLYERCSCLCMGEHPQECGEENWTDDEKLLSEKFNHFEGFEKTTMPVCIGCGV